MDSEQSPFSHYGYSDGVSMPDHVHLLVSIRPSVVIADMVREIKATSSKRLNETVHSRGWFRWEPGYGAFTVSPSETSHVRQFFRRQHRFHQTTTLTEEFIRFVETHGMEYDADPSEHRRHTYVWSRIHTVFSTKLRLALIPETAQKGLFQAFREIADNQRATLIEAGGVEDHVHLVLEPHRSVSAADLIRPIKNESTYWMRRQLQDESMFAWQRGYGAFSVSLSMLPTIRSYVQNQKEHHRETSFAEEFRELLIEHGFTPDNEAVRSPEGGPK